jgi:NADH-quinone oxidoreductase subunit A
MTQVVGHFLVFTLAAIGFLIAPLLIGKLVRPRLPSTEKDATYECGEPSIGSSYIQFDLRFYVVALLFIIFDVEVVFFFPWATVFGNAMQLADTQLSLEARRLLSEQLLSAPVGSITDQTAVTAETALQLGWTAFVDVAAFFAVLLVGIAYVGKRGDLDWVRSTAERKMKAGATTMPLSQAPTKKATPITAS